MSWPCSAGARENLHRGCEVIDMCPTKAHLQRTVHWAGPAQLELVSTSRGGVRCLTGVRQRHTFSGLALGLNPSAGARWHLKRGCEVFDRCPTKAHLQRTVHWAGPAQLELVSTSRGGVN